MFSSSTKSTLISKSKHPNNNNNHGSNDNDNDKRTPSTTSSSIRQRKGKLNQGSNNTATTVNENQRYTTSSSSSAIHTNSNSRNNHNNKAKTMNLSVSKKNTKKNKKKNSNQQQQPFDTKYEDNDDYDDDEYGKNAVDTRQGPPPSSAAPSFYRIAGRVVVFVLIAVVVIIAVTMYLLLEQQNDEQQQHHYSSVRSTTASTTITGNKTMIVTRYNVTSSTRTKRGTYKLIETIAHDTNAFTQGLITLYDGNTSSFKFYEGTGLNGRSELRHVTIPVNGSTEPGSILASYRLPYEYFGEGITAYIVNNTMRLIQLTWLNQVAFEYIIQEAMNTTTGISNNTNTTLVTPPILPPEYIPPSFLERLHILIQSTSFCRKGFGRRLRLCRTNVGANSNSNSSTTGTSSARTLQTNTNINTNPLLVNPPISSFQYTTTRNEGWGITYSKKSNVFYVTDGSNYIHVWDGKTKEEIHKFAVSYQYNDMSSSLPLTKLNEIEYDPFTDTILSNMWYENMIARIDITTGFVVAMYDFTTLYPKNTRTTTADSFNGIALPYDTLLIQDQIIASSSSGSAIPSELLLDQIWVTGKLWPKLYRVQLIE